MLRCFHNRRGRLRTAARLREGTTRERAGPPRRAAFSRVLQSKPTGAGIREAASGCFSHGWNCPFCGRSAVRFSRLQARAAKAAAEPPVTGCGRANAASIGDARALTGRAGPALTARGHGKAPLSFHCIRVPSRSRKGAPVGGMASPLRFALPLRGGPLPAVKKTVGGRSPGSGGCGRCSPGGGCRVWRGCVRGFSLGRVGFGVTGRGVGPRLGAGRGCWLRSRR
jgi:hypothetical protein